MRSEFDEMNAGRFRWDDEVNSDPQKFMSNELHSGDRKNFGLDDELRTESFEFDEQKVIAQINEYYDPMGISDSQKNFRKKKAKECFDDFLFMLYWIDTLREHGKTIQWDDVISECVKRLSARFGGTHDSNINDIIKSDSVDAMDVTERHIGEAYFVSFERAVNLGLEIASDIANYIDYTEAVKKGKTKKTWHTILDGRERISHRLMSGKRIKIDDLFLVGDSLMKYPRDMDYDPSPDEVCNCRCWCVYS